MTTTTIKVPSDLRDRLRSHADRGSRTLAQHIDLLLDLEDRDERFAAMQDAMARMTPAQQVAYERERDEWIDAPLG